ncbi:MAG: histidine kinase [Bacteroidota bacterium]
MLALTILSGVTALLLAGGIGWCHRRYSMKEQELSQSRRYLADGHEAERLAVARMLHDGPIQDLHALRMRLSLISFSAEGPGSPIARTATTEVATGIQEVIRELKRTSEALRPPALVPFGVGAALQAHVDRLRSLHPSRRFSLDLDNDAQALPLSVRLALFRIAQAAIGRAFAHRAERVSVVLKLDAERVLLEVCAEGTSHEPDRSTAPPPLSLIYERAQAIGAQVHTETEHSTRMRVRVFAHRDAPEWRALTVPPL